MSPAERPPASGAPSPGVAVDLVRAGFHVAADPRPTAEGWRIGITVTPASPWFLGHFPGEPILPAIGHLHLVTLAHRLVGGTPHLATVEHLRFADPVTPGVRLDLTLTRPDPERRSHFSLGREGDPRPTSRGAVTWAGAAPAERSRDEIPIATALRRDGEPAAAADPTLAVVAVEASGGPAVELPLPHAPPARFVDRALEATAEHAVCRGHVPRAHPAVTAGRAPAWIAVELAAQSAAALGPTLGPTLPAGAPAPHRVGYLVRLRDLTLHRPTVPADHPLLAEITRDSTTGPLSTHHATVHLDRSLVLTATFATYLRG